MDHHTTADWNAVTLTLGVISAIVFVIAWAIFLRGAVRMVRIIAQGQPAPDRWTPFIPRAAEVVVEFLAHTKMIKNRTVGAAHWFVMVGFLAGMVFWFESLPQVFDPHFHWPVVGSWPVYHLADEVLGIGTFFGILALIVVRQVKHPRSPERFSRFAGSKFGPAYTIEAIVLLEGIGFLSVKAAKLATYGDANPATDFLTMQLAHLLPSSPTLISIFAFIKFMSGASFLILVGSNLTWGVAWHRFSAFFNIYFKRELGSRRALGALKPMMSGGKVLEMETADPDNDAFGAGKMEDYSWKAWLDFTTCTECGRCQSQCPAWNTGKPLSPKLLIMGLRDHGYAKAPYLLAGGRTNTEGDEVGLVTKAGEPDADKLEKIPAAALAEAERPLVGHAGAGDELGGVIDPEVLWSCTTCGACVEQCPVDIEHVDHIVDMRRYQVLIESEFPQELAGLFKNLENKGNPWGQNSSQRTAWIDEMDIDIPVFGEDTDSFAGYEYLFWVGCAGAYEDRAKKTTKAVAELLDLAAVDFLVLGQGETCTGDSARRAGNEFLFQMLAQQNVEQLDELFDGVPEGQRKIVVTCAHCFNALGNEYPQVGGNYEVVHHTQLLNKLVREKRLVPVAPPSEDVTYHDPCYLGRHNQVYEAPRELIGASGATFKEMPRHLERSMCCGAGGARMWMEEQIGKRINIDRVDEALNTLSEMSDSSSETPQKIATGCPFCRVMLSDGVTAQTADSDAPAPEVVDVSQMLLESVRRGLPDDVVRGDPNRTPSDAPAEVAGDGETENDDSEPIAPAAKTDTAAAPAGDAPAAKKDAKPAVGLGIAGGGKRPGSGPKKPGGAPKPGAAKPGAAKPASAEPAGQDAASDTAEQTAAAPAAPAKPAVGLGLAGGAKRPGAPKKPGAAKPAAAADGTADDTADGSADSGDTTAAPEDAQDVKADAPAAAAKPAVGLGLAGGAKRPGAKKPGAPKPAAAAASKPDENAAAVDAPAADAPAESAPAPDRTVSAAGEAKAAGFGIAAGAKRPGAPKAGAPKTEAPKASATPAAPAAAAAPVDESPTETAEVEESAEVADVAESAPPAPDTHAAAADDRTLSTAGEAKAAGFGIAAGAKRPGAPKPGAPKAAAPKAEEPKAAAPIAEAPEAEVPENAAPQPAAPEPAAPEAEAAPVEESEPQKQEHAAGSNGSRTLDTAGESKAHGFGISAGAKRPGGRK